MMTFSVTFSVTTYTGSLQQLTECLGQPDPNSYTKGPEEDGRFNDRSVWVIEAIVPPAANLDAHLNSLADQFDFGLLKDERLPEDIEKDLIVGAFFDDACCSVSIHPDWFNLMGEHRVELEVTCYPCTFEAPAPSEGT